MGYYTWINDNENSYNRLSIDEVANFFDLISEEEINLFTFQKRDGTLIGIKDYFKAHHYNQICRYRKNEKNIAQNKFLLIYNDSAWDIIRLKEHQKLLTQLIDLKNNWRDTTEHIGNTEFKSDDLIKITEDNTQTDERGIMAGLLSGQVDASQLSKVDIKNLLNYSQEKILGYLDPNTRSRSHQINIEGGKNKLKFDNSHENITKNDHKTKNNSTTHFSNTSKDIIDVINLKIPGLIEIFLDKFNPLFLY